LAIETRGWKLFESLSVPRFTACTALTQSLNAARATGVYDWKLGTLARVGLLTIDDFGLKPLRAPAPGTLITLR
jgi:hypothetical protein